MSINPCAQLYKLTCFTFLISSVRELEEKFNKYTFAGTIQIFNGFLSNRVEKEKFGMLMHFKERMLHESDEQQHTCMYHWVKPPQGLRTSFTSYQSGFGLALLGGDQ